MEKKKTGEITKEQIWEKLEDIEEKISKLQECILDQKKCFDELKTKLENDNEDILLK